MTTNHTAGPWHRNIKPASKYPVVFAGRNTHVAQVESKGLADTEVEANCNLITAAPDLLWELEQTGVYAIELMERAARLDRKLAELTGATLDCELGEIVRLRQQLSRNRAVIDKANGSTP